MAGSTTFELIDAHDDVLALLAVRLSHDPL